jgi:GNAT superfamily N-acetyltransferase
MPSASVVVQSPVVESPRVLQLRGLFDLPVSKTSCVSWDVVLPIEERDWNVGLIVGPSGCGKSTIARHLWPMELGGVQEWSPDAAVVDGFPEGQSIKETTGLLSSVGFSSPPAWLRPFHVLSTGEQFRVSIARLLAESPSLVVVDEFTSVVDRTVAQVGSAAIAKTVRRRGQRLVAVTCHEDVEAWLEPDWIYRPASGEFTWGYLQRRDPLEIRVCRVPSAAWGLFRHHHYLNTSINRSAVCFGAFLGGRIVGFTAWLPLAGFVGRRRAHRTVVLPDYQGVGIGNRLSALIASMWVGLGMRASSTASHPAFIAARNASRDWALTRRPSRTGVNHAGFGVAASSRRLTCAFEYVGPAMARLDAERLRECWAEQAEFPFASLERQGVGVPEDPVPLVGNRP